MGERLPDWLVLGPPRTGTTWLYRAVRNHPGVFVPEEKQLHFFDRHWDRGSRWYAGRFRAADPEARAGELTPDYLSHPDTLERIHDLLDARVSLFVIHRDPVERAWSEYRVRADTGELRELAFIEALERAPRLADNSRYGRHLERLLEVFPPDRIRVLSFELLEEDPEGFLRSFLRSLDVSPDHRPPVLGRRVAASPDPAAWPALRKGLRTIREALEGTGPGRKLMWVLRDAGVVGAVHAGTAGDVARGPTRRQRRRARELFSGDANRFRELLKEVPGGGALWRGP